MMLINSNANLNISTSLILPQATTVTTNTLNNSNLKSTNQYINSNSAITFSSNERMEDCNNNNISIQSSHQQHNNQNFQSLANISNGVSNSRDLDQTIDSSLKMLGGGDGQLNPAYTSLSPPPSNSIATNSYNNNTSINGQRLFRCTGCHSFIEDKYICNLMNTYWHEECLVCSQCGCLLSHSCFSKNGQLFCKDDYFKNFGTRCFGCRELINSSELVMRVESHHQTGGLIHYHLNCFKCIACDRIMQKGDEYVLRSEGIYCKFDFDHQKYQRHSSQHQHYSRHPQHSKHQGAAHSIGSSTSPTSSMSSSSGSIGSAGGLLLTMSKMVADDETSANIVKTVKQQPISTGMGRKSSSRRVTKRPRTILNATQRYDFREAFKQSQKPCRKVREHLAEKTGLSVRVVQVWFQNERAKVKKMQRRMQQQHQHHQQGGHLNRSLDAAPMSKANRRRSKKTNGNKLTSADEEETTTTTTTTTTNEEEEDEDEDEDEDEEDDDDEELSESSEDELDLERSEMDDTTTNQDEEMNGTINEDDIDMISKSKLQQQRIKRDAFNLNTTTDTFQSVANFHNPIDRLYSMQSNYF